VTDLDLRPALATLRAYCENDGLAFSIMVADEQPLIIAGLCELLVCFIRDVSSDPTQHLDVMFRAAAAAERGRE